MKAKDLGATGGPQFTPLIRRLDMLQRHLNSVQRRLEDIIQRMDRQVRETHLTIQTK